MARAIAGGLDLDEERLARYLLGELSPDEEAAIDGVLGDDDVWDMARRVEDDLLDAYASGRLDPARQERLAVRSAASPRLRERIELFRDLRTVAASRRRQRARPRVRVAAAGLAAAFAVAAAFLIFAIMRDDSPPGVGDGVGEVVALTLPPATRAAAIPAVQLRRRATLALTVVVEPEEAFPRHRVRITMAGAVVWSQDGLRASDGALALSVPGSALAAGVHQLEIAGLGEHGEVVRLGTRSFRVVR